MIFLLKHSNCTTVVLVMTLLKFWWKVLRNFSLEMKDLMKWPIIPLPPQKVSLLCVILRTSLTKKSWITTRVVSDNISGSTPVLYLLHGVKLWFKSIFRSQFTILRVRLLQASASMLWQLCHNASDYNFIENSEFTWKWVATPIWSYSIVFNENSIGTVIAALILTLGVDGP